MNIIIKDKQGLGIALQMAGYPQEERMWARDAIREQFRNTSKKVFQDVLGRSLPESIVVNTALNDNDELKGEKAAKLASYNLLLSKPDCPLFTVNEISVKKLLDSKDIKSFESTTIHEMFHAADQHMLFNDYQLLHSLQTRMNSFGVFEQIRLNQSIALLQTLRMFNHYRAEGLAVLGENLLMKTPISYLGHPVERFRNGFLGLIINSCEKADGNRNDFDADMMDYHAYKDTPFIMLLVLYKRDIINKELTQKAVDSITSECFKLTDEEVQTIMKAALDLSPSGFIHGLMLLGNEVAPIMPFLYFCGKLQSDYEKSHAEVFAQLTKQPESVETFNMAMDQIMGCCIPEDELDEHIQDIIDHPLSNPTYPELKEKVSALYSILKHDTNNDRKRLAQWALTFFFDDEDLIHDEITGLGFIDDMIVLDYAMKLLQTT